MYNLIHDIANVADSFMTPPSWPVNLKYLLFIVEKSNLFNIRFK